jgi:hypothetical protein
MVLNLCVATNRNEMKHAMNDNDKSRKLIKASKWNTHHEWPSQGGLRHLIFNADKNGFDRVIKRVGRVVLIDEIEFFEWVDAQNQASTLFK